MHLFQQLFDSLHGWLFETAVQPALYALGFINYDEQAYDALEVFMYGVVEVAFIYALLRPLEWLHPAEPWENRRAVRVDVVYTLLHRLGFLPLVLFLLLQPFADDINGSLRLHNIIPPNLEDLIPGLVGHPLRSFLLYVVILDLAEYLRHRLQHRFNWWWALHGLHHSQRQMSLWSDDRNHLLDDLLANLWLAVIGLLIGVPPGQFVFIVIAMRMLESLAHANIRMGFGALGNRLVVSPHYHRIHHGIGIGHEGRVQGCNFAVLLPLWDILFGTAHFARDYPATGIRDQLEGADYGERFWQQQILGIKRLVASLRK